MSKKVLQFTLTPRHYDEEVMLLPFVENLENELIDDWEYETDEEALELLTEKWNKKSWDYDKGTTFTLKLIDAYTEKEAKEIGKQLELFIREKEIELPMLPDSMDTNKCSEFEIICFSENMIEPDMYDTPFDNIPNDYKFSCRHAFDCMEGSVYSKDFRYFYCECCSRTICEQNPRNGWHTQYRIINECEQICTKCYEEQMFESGVDLDEVLRTETIPGSFFGKSELEDAGFEILDGMDGVQVGHGYSTYSDPKYFFKKLTERYDELKDKIVIFDYNTMSIGGMGGYVTVWIKDKENNK